VEEETHQEDGVDWPTPPSSPRGRISSIVWFVLMIVLASSMTWYVLLIIILSNFAFYEF